MARLSQGLGSVAAVTPPGARDELYCYCAVSRRGPQSAYLVRRLRTGAVVATIEPLGTVRTAATEAEVLALGLQRRLWISGRWRATASGRHARVRVRSLPSERSAS
ncbi:MAG: hypothetical protein ACHQFZ_01815 [Acidimicrobiales bacterium]